ncbi:MAG: cytochrome c biogenesis protein CcdA [Planctomycetota bacterium]
MTRFSLYTRLLALTLASFVTAQAHAQFQQDPVTWSIELSQSQARPGDQVIVAVKAVVTDETDRQGKHWHFYPRQDEHRGVEKATVITPGFDGLPLRSGAVQWPAPQNIINATGAPQPAYEGVQYFYIPVLIAEDAEPGTLTLPVEVYFQACSSFCIAPKTVTVEAELEVVSSDAATPGSRADDEAFAGFDADAFTAMTGSDSGTPSLQNEGVSPGDSGAEAEASAESGAETPAPAGSTISVPFIGEIKTEGFLGLLIVILLAFVGGTVLNLMPCVLPIIPIKIMGLTKASGSRGKSVFLGLMMLLGVMSLWVVIGVAIASLKQFDSVSSLFQKPLFSISVGLFILAMGVGMMGLFTVQLPQFVYRVNPKHDSATGAFGFGVMAAVLSTPCTAPFMGASITWATQQPHTYIVIAVFIAIGLGMGWPYLVLAAFPKLVEKVPRTGPASELVKQILGLMMIAAAVFFTGAGVLGLLRQYPFLGPVLYWWLTTGVVGVMAFWLILRTFQITPAAGRRIVFTLIGLAMFSGMGWFAYSQTMIEHFKHTNTEVWVDYDASAFANARSDGSIAIVDFTADW